MNKITQPRRNMPVSYNPVSGGRPAYASNHWMLPNDPPDRYSGGQLVTAAEAQPEEVGEKSYRMRAEVICTDGTGILCIRKPGYLLLPGGGLDTGETAKEAIVREALEEAGIRLRDLVDKGSIQEDTPDGHPLAKGTDGVITTFFTASTGGEWFGNHPDREEFAFLPFEDTLNFLAKCLIDPEQDYAVQYNEKKLALVELMRQTEVKTEITPEICHLADSTSPSSKAFMFDLDGTLRDWKTESYKDPEAIFILPKRLDFLKSLKDNGYTLIGVTNHSSYPDDEISGVTLRECQERTNHLLGNLLDDIYWMSRYSEALAKPNPVMLQRAMKDWGIETTAYIGDMDMDKKAAEACGIPFVHVDDIFGKHETKIADVPVVLPKQEYMLFSHEGKLFVRPKGNRRFDFPTEGSGKHIPYTQPTRYLPTTGVPEPGVHGYEYSWNAGDTDLAPQGFEARDPDEVLKTMYGGMGLSENREYQGIDRARVQALLRAWKSRKKPTQPEVVHDTYSPPQL